MKPVKFGVAGMGGYAAHIGRLLEELSAGASPGIETLFQDCIRTGSLPHETGMARWTVPAGRMDLREYHHFGGTRTTLPE
jgi:hypothetical protein